MTINGFIERFIFKKRNIIYYHPSASQSSVMVSMTSMSDLDSQALSLEVDSRLESYLRRRKGSSSWILFVMRKESRIQGYSFLHVPAADEWNDSLPTLKGEARISSIFVFPEFRGFGVQGELFKAQAIYAKDRGLKLWAVIEDSNNSSMRSALKVGYVARANYLIKFLGRNIISVVTNPTQLYLLYNFRRAVR